MKVRLLLIALLSSLLVGCNKEDDKMMNDTFYNPLVIEKDMGDPYLYLHDNEYYYMHSEGARITLTKSKYMTQLTKDESDETRTKIILRAKNVNLVQIWAPEIFYFEDYWYIYFTASIDDASSSVIDENRRSYGMKSKTSDAFGEWEEPVKIDLPCDYRSIDATFMDYNGHQYIIYSGWPSLTNSNYQQNLYITELETHNPLKAKSLEEGERHLISTPDYPYEKSNAIQNEGPAVGYSPNGVPVIFYSGNYSGGDNYCISYLRLDGDDVTLKSSWYKPDTPLMKTDMEYSEVIAPGHCSITKSIDGKEDWMMYHAAKLSGSGWDRMARLQKFTWDNNTPVVEKIYKIADEVALPSGEKVNRAKYEAEEANLTSDVYIIEKEGYASKNKCVSIENGGNITFEIDVPENGKYVLEVRFANRDSSENTMDVTVNGELTKLYAPNTQYDDSFTISSFFTELYIKKEGHNEIIISADASIYIDCIIIDYLDHS